MKKIKLMADYDCWPLWEDGTDAVGNINPEQLPLSEALRENLMAWQGEFDRTLNRNDPLTSGWTSTMEEEIFDAKGFELCRLLQAELGTEYRVSYFSSINGRLEP